MGISLPPSTTWAPTPLYQRHRMPAPVAWRGHSGWEERLTAVHLWHVGKQLLLVIPNPPFWWVGEKLVTIDNQPHDWAKLCDVWGRGLFDGFDLLFFWVYTHFVNHVPQVFNARTKEEALLLVDPEFSRRCSQGDLDTHQVYDWRPRYQGKH